MEPSRPHDTLFAAAQGIVKTLAEEHGYIVVSPLGYAPLGGYGQHYDIGMRPPVEGATAEEQERVSKLSEEDVMKVVALVTAEYGVDQSRIYLMGHSMGGLGTWYLGEKYRDKWAGLAPIAGGFENTDYPWERLRGMPVLVSNGSADTVAIPSRAPAGGCHGEGRPASGLSRSTRGDPRFNPRFRVSEDFRILRPEQAAVSLTA
jgi:predicted peptidase